MYFARDAVEKGTRVCAEMDYDGFLSILHNNDTNRNAPHDIFLSILYQYFLMAFHFIHVSAISYE